MPDRLRIDPRRKPRRMRPFTALSCMRKLIADAEDTRLVFEIIDALNGNSTMKDLKRFVRSEKGAAEFEKREYLPPHLDDHDRWKALPDGTVGRAYVAFMEAEGLSAKGLVEDSLKQDRPRFDDDFEWYGNRLRDVHDLYHVLTGYGRDGLGESSLQGFTWGQHKGNGMRFISYMGCRNIRNDVPSHVDIMACYREGKANGLAAKRIIEEDILAMMEEPIDEVRARLNIREPVAYNKAQDYFAEVASARMAVAAE